MSTGYIMLGVFNCVSRYLNTQHIKKQKASDAELLYGTLSYESPEQMKEIGELGTLCFLYFLFNKEEHNP
jgi:hypothetical protein